MTDLTDPPTAVPTELEHIIDSLAAEFAGIHAPETVARVVVDGYLDLARAARIPNYVPLLAGRFARDQLRAAAIVEGTIMSGKPEVLFVCVHNAGRSQMAAALLNHYAQGRVVVRSAGSAPADTINPAAIDAMSEAGIDLSQEFPKRLSTEAVQASDVVITMGCGDACPIFPGKRYLDWTLDDPAGKDIATVRRIRDQIDTLVRDLLTDLLPGESVPESPTPSAAT
jgi:protein-tyrosine-phosphatase